MQLFHFFPIYSTDPIVRRGSLQKTSQAKKPVAIFNPVDFAKAHLTDGENVKFIFSEEHKQNEVVLEVTSDEKVSKGVIAVAVGSLKASNVGNAITSFQNYRIEFGIYILQIESLGSKFLVLLGGILFGCK